LDWPRELRDKEEGKRKRSMLREKERRKRKRSYAEFFSLSLSKPFSLANC
jgi:hypothetical protein